MAGMQSSRNMDERSRKRKLCLHTQLIANLACDYLDPRIDGGIPAKKFRLHARRFFTTPAERCKEAPEDVLDALELKGCIGPGDYEELIPLVEQIDVGMVKLIRDTERKIERIDGEDDSSSQCSTGKASFMANVIANTKTEVMEHEADKTYVTTKAAEAGMNIVQKKNILVIVGSNGSGKTKCALDILSKLSSGGMRVIKLSDIRDWNKAVNANSECCVWLDNMSGDIFIEKNGSMFATIKACTQIGKLKAIITMQTRMYSKHKSYFSALLSDTFVVNMDTREYHLTRITKSAILKSHLQAHDIPIVSHIPGRQQQSTGGKSITKPEVDEILQSRTFIPFPLCCHLFASIDSNFQKGVAFFTCPTNDIIQNIRKLRHCDKRKYLMLTYAALKDRVIDMNNLDTELLRDLSNLLYESTEYSTCASVQSALDDMELDDLYIQPLRYKVYEIRHQIIYKAIIVSLAETSDNMKIRLVKMLNSTILIETLISEDHFKGTFEYNIVVPMRLNANMARILLERIQEGDTSLFNSDLWNSRRFIEAACQEITDEWHTICESAIRQACKYGKVILIQYIIENFASSFKEHRLVLIGIKEACVHEQEEILYLIFNSTLSASLSTDDMIKLLDYAWANHRLGLFLVTKISDMEGEISKRQIRNIFLCITRDECTELANRTIEKFGIKDMNIICYVANIAGRRGAIEFLRLLMTMFADVTRGANSMHDLLHSAMIGACRGGSSTVASAIIGMNKYVLQEHVEEYLEYAETPNIIEIFLQNSSLTKEQMIQALHCHCKQGRPLIVKVLIEKFTILSGQDIKNAMKLACHHDNLSILDVIADTVSIPHEAMTEVLNSIENWSFEVYSDGVSVSESIVSRQHSFDHQRPTKKIFVLRRSLNRIHYTYRKVLRLNQLCERRNNVTNDSISLCKELIASDPDLPEFLLVECAKFACRYNNFDILQVFCEYDPDLPSKILSESDVHTIDYNTIQCIHIVMRRLGLHSLILFVRYAMKNTKFPPEFDKFLGNLTRFDCKFESEEYIEVLGYMAYCPKHVKVFVDHGYELTQQLTKDKILFRVCKEHPDAIEFLISDKNMAHLSKAIIATLNDSSAMETLGAKKYRLFRTVFENFPYIDSSRFVEKLYLDICNQQGIAQDILNCLRLILEGYMNHLGKDVIIMGLHSAIDNISCRVVKIVIQFYSKKYDGRDILPYVIKIFRTMCETCSFGEECMQLILDLYADQIADDVLIEGLNNALRKSLSTIAPIIMARCPCTQELSAQTVYIVLSSDSIAYKRLLFKHWNIAEEVKDNIVEENYDVATLWSILRRRFRGELTCTMTFQILELLCKYQCDDATMITTILSTDTVRSNSEIRALLLRCNNLSCVEPLLRRYHNLPMYDLLIVCYSLLKSGKNLHAHTMLRVYAKLSSVATYRQLAEDIISQPCFASREILTDADQTYVATSVIEHFLSKLRS